MYFQTDKPNSAVSRNKPKQTVLFWNARRKMADKMAKIRGLWPRPWPAGSKRGFFKVTQLSMKMFQVGTVYGLIRSRKTITKKKSTTVPTSLSLHTTHGESVSKKACLHFSNITDRTPLKNSLAHSDLYLWTCPMPLL